MTYHKDLIARLRRMDGMGDIQLNELMNRKTPLEAEDAIESLQASRDAMVRNLEPVEKDRDEQAMRAEAAEQLATARLHTIHRLQGEASSAKVERDALAARLKELEGQEPVAWVDVKDSYEGPYSFNGMNLLPVGKHHLFARPVPAEQAPPATRPGWRDINDIVADREKDPSKAAALDRARARLADQSVPAEPVNARLVEALKRCKFDSLNMSLADLKFLRDALAAADTQQSDPVRLTNEEIVEAKRRAVHYDCMVPFAQSIAFARAIESAVLRKQGYKVEG